MDTDNEKPRPPQGGSSEPSMDTDKMYADDNESPSEDEDGEPSMSPSGDGDPSIGTGDWRSQLQPDTRQRIVNKIMETLKRHLPFSGQEGLQELKKIAVRFEEKIYAAATSQHPLLLKPEQLQKLKQITEDRSSGGLHSHDFSESSHGSINCNSRIDQVAFEDEITSGLPNFPASKTDH